MLGRLFNNNRSNEHLSNKGITSNPVLPHHYHPYDSSTNGATSPIQINNAAQAVECSNYTNEDSYSRTILYGTPNHLQSFNLESYNFRLIIIQDKGEILMKNNYKTYYDSALDTHFNRPMHNKLNNKHDSTELIDVMFGNPIHHNLNTSDHFKIHVLSSLQGLKHSILVTKHFYVDKKHNFAIGLVIPISLDHISTAVLSNWNTITNHLNLVKAIFLENHLNSKKCGTTPVASSNYLDISIFFKSFIKSIKYLSTVPRLLLGLNKFDSILQNWCLEVINWIEVKDGAKLGFSGSKFLTTLLSIVYLLKDQLVSNENNPDERVRIVIMASNPMIAQKLIFIMSGLLPFDLDFKTLDYQDMKSLNGTVCDSNNSSTKASKLPGNEGNNNNNNNDTNDNEHEHKTPPTPSVIKNGWEIPSNPSKSVATPSIMTPCRSSIIQPSTSMSNANSMTYLSSSLSSSSTFSSSLSRGFQLLQNWKSSSDINNSFNNNVNLNNSNNSYGTNASSSSSSSISCKSPSPHNEYDDYPWNSNLNQMSHPNYTTLSSATHSLPRTNSSYDLSCFGSIPKNLKRLSIPKLPHIERTTTTLYKIGEYQKTKTQFFNNSRQSCFSLMRSKDLNTSVEQDDIKNVSILDVSFEDDEDELNNDDNDNEEEDDSNNYKHYTLPQLCGYVNEYIPDFNLQACPISQDLDSKIISSMKNDLNTCKKSKTILVSLRAREIKEMSLFKTQHEYKSTIKKLYHNSRPGTSVDKTSWMKIDSLLDSIVSIFRDHDGENDDRGFDEVARLLQDL